MEGANETLRVIEDAVVDLKCVRECVRECVRKCAHANLCWHASESSRAHIARKKDISRMQTRTRTHLAARWSIVKMVDAKQHLRNQMSHF